jgi:transcription elongation factor Elf1
MSERLRLDFCDACFAVLPVVEEWTSMGMGSIFPCIVCGQPSAHSVPPSAFHVYRIIKHLVERVRADETSGDFECPTCGARHATRKWEDVRAELEPIGKQP